MKVYGHCAILRIPRPIFRNDDWNYYKKVNEDFARAVLEETE